MGGGASRRKNQGAGAADPAAVVGPKLPEKFGADPALRRRRRVLFGGGSVPRRFELVKPKEQYKAAQDEPEDPTFQRLGAEVETFRRRAEHVQSKKSGYLDENAIELLGLGLAPGSFLSKRLFHVAQAQIIEGKRRTAMTCYELLSLHGLLRNGSTEDLLELLFCVFDYDGDDHLTRQDLSLGVLAFLELPEASENLDGDGLKDFKRLNVKGRRREARRIADLAIKTYATASDFEQTGNSSVESSPPSSPDPSGRQDASSLKEGPSSIKDDEENKSEQTPALDNLSTTPATTGAPVEDATPKAQPKRRGLCRGKAPADDDSKSEGEAPASKIDSMQTETGEPKRRSRGLCRGKAPADDKSSDGEQTPKKRPPPPASRRQGSCMGGGRKKKGPPALTYSQWLQWLAVSGLMPAGLADVAADIAAAEASKSFISAGPQERGERASSSDSRGQNIGRPPADTFAASSGPPAAAEQRRIDDGAGVDPFPQQSPLSPDAQSNVVGSMTRSFQDDEDGSSDDSDHRPAGNRQMKEHLLG